MTVRAHPPVSSTAQSAIGGPRVRVVVRPIASPLALGFGALCVGSLSVAGLQLGWLRPGDAHAVGFVLMAFVAPLQLLVSVLAFLSRDETAATGMGTLGGTWLVVGLAVVTSSPGATSRALSLLLFGSAGILLGTVVPAWSSKRIPALVLTTAALRFTTTGVAQWTGAASWERIAGIIGLVLAAFALYAATASSWEGQPGSPHLPLARAGAGARAVEATLPEQVVDVAREPGVRRML